MSKKWSNCYTAYKEIIKTINAQLQAACQNLVDTDKELMALRLAIEEIVQVEGNVGRAKGFDEVTGEFTSISHLFILMLDSDSSEGYSKLDASSKLLGKNSHY
ncbi:hypothetical protein AX14_007855 [Amanita brunnescens Koide BX004]|nr:hypothetical protein AX14_007855 [Amanita brunnescens Koide BX004]